MVGPLVQRPLAMVMLLLSRRGRGFRIAREQPVCAAFARYNRSASVAPAGRLGRRSRQGCSFQTHLPSAQSNAR